MAIVNNNFAEINMTELSKGVYIFKIINEDKNYITRIVYQ